MLFDPDMKLLSKLSIAFLLAAVILSGTTLTAQTNNGAESREIAQKRANGGKPWKQLLSRFDADGDNDISAAEAARHAEWNAKRKSLRTTSDTNGNGKIDPAEQNGFKQAIKDLNQEYFVKKQGQKDKKAPANKKGANDSSNDEDDSGDDLSDIFGE